MVRLINYSVLLLCLVEGLRAYDIPKPIIKVYSKGFEASIPNEPGITFFSFEAKRNSKITKNVTATWRGYSCQADSNEDRWIIRNSNAKLLVGDTLYYSIYVIKDNKLNKLVNGVYDVEYHTSSYKFYTVPEPRIIIYSKGFEVSIPDESGIVFFGFSGSPNATITQRNPGTWIFTSFHADKNHRWTYKNSNAELKVGDALHYAIFVTRDGQLHDLLNRVYTVEQLEVTTTN